MPQQRVHFAGIWQIKKGAVCAFLWQNSTLKWRTVLLNLWQHCIATRKITNSHTNTVPI